ncbi:MAG TPA: hypothetical protein VFN31_01670 [Candidatus Saccharimonadales bacterium]|nr:hypothetical protein [Candidatus Saccharimonadales bacterium]
MFRNLENTPPADAPATINTYNHTYVADLVLWPLVSEFWRENFRLYAGIGDSIDVTTSASYKGSLYIVGLEANVETIEDEDDELLLLYSALTLSIGKVATGYQRQHIIDMALQARALSKQEAYSSHTFAQSVREYYFTTEGDFELTTFQAISNTQGVNMWERYNENEDTLEGRNPFIANSVLLDIDMQQIEAATYVLNAPELIKNSLHRLHALPAIKTLTLSV